MSVVAKKGRDQAVIAMLIFNHLKNTGVISSIISNMNRNEMDLEYINITPFRIGDKVLGIDFQTQLLFYKPKWWFSKAYAKVISGKYDKLWLSLRKINREIPSLCGSIAHEWGHCLEFFWKQQVDASEYFNHGDNTRKDDTFQYMLGARVKKYVERNGNELLRAVGALK